MIGPSWAIGGGAADEQSSSHDHDQTHGCEGEWSPVCTPPTVTGAATFAGACCAAAPAAPAVWLTGAAPAWRAACATFVATACALATLTCVTGPWSPGLRMLTGM